MTVRILQGDCRDMLRTLPDGSAQCCVTSPPYFGLRDYGHAGQIGLEPTPAEYVAQMVEVFREVRRVLRDDGTLFLNIGDSYFHTHPSGPQGKSGDRASRRFTAAGAGAGRADPCGTSGKAPASSTASDCLCGSLCDACRKAYRFGKSHSDGLRVPMPAPSLSASSRERKESSLARLPTSDLTPPADRNEAATLPAAQAQDRDPEPHRASPESTTGESSLQHQEAPHLSGQPSECQLCGCSLRHSVPASERMAVCSCDTSERGSAADTSGMGVSGSAYPHFTSTSLKPKDLIGIPWMVAFALQADGWYLRQDIIWHKPNPMPESVTDRCTKAHEYLFLLSKSERYFFDHAALREPVSEATLADGRQARGTRGTKGEYAAIDGNCGFAADGLRNKRSVWTIATKPFSEAHFATMAPELAETCIKAGCPKDGTVLDPFGGAGTTGLVADQLQRDAVLCELNPEYIAIARRRIAGDAPLFADVEVA